MTVQSGSVSISAFGKAYRQLCGTGVGRIPGVNAVSTSIFWHLWGSKSPIIEIQGSKMCMSPVGLPKSYQKTFQAYIMQQEWERLMTPLFKEAVEEADIFVDLGANIGYFTLLAARHMGERGKIYAFEPEPTNYSLLLKNIEVNGYNNIIPVQKAVSNTNGTVRFFLDRVDTGGHTIYQPEGRKEFIEIESVTLDEFFKDKGFHIDVIKMDVEGAEAAALQGMEEIIRENSNLKLFIEFYPQAIRRSGNSPREFARILLEDYHFSVLAMSDYSRDKYYSKIGNADELMNLCLDGHAVNLFCKRIIHA